MKIEVDERNASDVGELVASGRREAAGKAGTEKSGNDHLGGLKSTYL